MDHGDSSVQKYTRRFCERGSCINRLRIGNGLFLAGVDNGQA